MPDDRDEREEAVRGLARGRRPARVLRAADPRAWTDLDEDVREAVERGDLALRPAQDRFAAVAPERPARWRGLLGPGGPSLTSRPGEAELALALCDPDGRIREAALGHAGSRPGVLPLVAIRATDWARPVRELALDVLRTALPTAQPGTLAVTAPVILRIARRQRGDEVSALLTEHLRDCPRATLTSLLLNPDRATRRLALRLAVARGLLDAERLARLAAADTDVAVQDIAADAALTAMTAETADQVLALLLAGRTGRVRAAGVTALRRAGRHAEGEPFLYDRSAMVRACARWVLRQDGTDPLPLYRARCADPAGTPGRAPLGLAECGEAGVDTAVLWELTAHADPLVRASAVAGLRAFGVPAREGDRTRLLPLLADPAPGVVRETARGLKETACLLPPDELVRLIGPDRPPHVRARALGLLGAQGGTLYTETVRRLVEDADPVLSPPVRRAHGLPQPTPAGRRRRLWRV
ncbi:hypothetical protein EAO71_08630 [Streptomyces sp. ms191]|uniref:hypothetical protein n=1 Tax=Streptomyces sp. ms191 TaxID=1827978 RepID=UPI0011CD7E84|nr:hypothetical protein [Streptomyces sp. ms191]TXS28835.1 hypothetical protein EAO71_08630 [Streptomyces sp. ms191]